MTRRPFGLTALLSAFAMAFAAVWYATEPPSQASAETVADTASVASVYYSGCKAARAAGAAPIYRGQPGYRPEMDGDEDGIACEPYRGRGY